MKIDVVASEPHYLRHIMPIWRALPDRLRGDVRVFDSPGAVTRPPFGRPALVAGWQDVAQLRSLCRMIYVEHGAGQTYVDALDDPSYSGTGGGRHTGVIGFIAPSDTVAARWTSAPAVAAGCPKMDEWIGKDKPVSSMPTVVLAWHWECTLVPETRSAWRHYEPHLTHIVDRWQQQGWEVALHFHPKWRGRLDHVADELGASLFVAEEMVFRHGDVLMVDNSSLAYEFASLGRPVVCLNAPWYRRDVEHGLRFWQYAPGLEVDDASALAEINLWDFIEDTPRRNVSLRLGELATRHAYAHIDGRAAQRAAAFIEQLIDGQ